MFRNSVMRWISFASIAIVFTTMSIAWVHSQSKAPASQVSKPAEEVPNFSYDRANQVVQATLLENPLWYDADIVVRADEQWFAWLEFTPGKGDRIWVGLRKGNDWEKRSLIIENHGEYACPTLTVNSNQQMCLSYERLDKGQWDICVVPLKDGQASGLTQTVSISVGADIRHKVAADSEGGLWFVWQSDQNGQLDVVARQLKNGILGKLHLVGQHEAGDWHPHIAIDNNNTVYVVWDAYDGESFNVYLRSLSGDHWSELRTIAGSPAFEGRPKIAIDHQSRIWIAWEEGGENWGKPFRGRHVEALRDDHGPLHRFRQLKLAVLDEAGNLSSLVDSLRLPSLALATQRKGMHAGSERTGAFYERAALSVDSVGRPWIFYRHYYTPWLSIDRRVHVEQGWGVYARCYGDEGWSPLFKMQIGQGDGMQRLALTPIEQGIAAVWTTGRTHRDRNQRPRGIVSAMVSTAGTESRQLNLIPVLQSKTKIPIKSPRDQTGTTDVANKQYQLFFGDLHRHTDLSLCRVPLDGTIDDAYRYAIDVARLDFLGITDHSRDIAQGDPLSLLWWRSSKEVERHRLGSKFLPFFAYERSHSNTADHNVISLRSDMLRPHTYPLPDFWTELDRDTITIPHQPIRRNTWNYHDDRLRPLAEVFQGCRDNSIEEDLHRGLARGYHFGFIASSDHMSTSASYACVWAEEATRESIFRAMQARRTYGATDKIWLKVTAASHWMGELVTAAKMPKLLLEAQGTAIIRKVYLVVDGKIHETFTTEQQTLDISHQLNLAGKHYVYFHLVQEDGNEAWSSPLWFNIDSTKQPGEQQP